MKAHLPLRFSFLEGCVVFLQFYGILVTADGLVQQCVIYQYTAKLEALTMNSLLSFPKELTYPVNVL